MIARLRPAAASAFDAALTALSRCADEVSVAGSSMASNYVAGAAGNLRHALACLAVFHPEVAVAGAPGFDERRVGRSVVIGEGGVADTIMDCAMPDGTDGRAVALVPAADPALGVWLRPSPEAPHLHVRGGVARVGAGYGFVEDAGREAPAPPAPGPDLGRDLLLADGLDLSARPALASAMELALATGSWVHRTSGSRWYADLAGARAVVRMLRGVPSLDRSALTRMGVCIDREALLAIERLGWRHWPTPGLED